jgi:cation diffusion facilitator family transporter
VQEGLRNVAKHANADHVTVRVQVHNGMATAEVADDGEGFTPNGSGGREHMGLDLLSDLAEEAGGTLAIESRPGAGTVARVMIVVAALLIMREAFAGILHARPLDAPLHGLLVNGVASVINAAWCWVLITRGRRDRSPALVADGRHLLTDVVSSVGVTLGVLLAIVTGWAILDPALAALVAVNILWSGWRVMKESLGGLMDEAVPGTTLALIRRLIAAEAEGALEAHDLRTRHAGRMTMIDFHLVVPAEMSVKDAHDICDRIEGSIKSELGEALITIHVEPEDKAKHSGIVVL